MTKEIAASAAQGAPGYVVTGSWLAGIHLSDVAVVLTVAWTALSILHLIVKWNRE